MPLIGTRGAASAQGFGEFAQSAAPNYIEDVFSTYLYTGNGSTQTITNGIDLAGNGGLLWMKNRNGAPANNNNNLVDTIRGVSAPLYSNTTDGQLSQPTIASFNSTGFSLGAFGTNASGTNYASWTFCKQPKFFDVVTYTGNGTGGRQIPHSLGSVPGCIIVKALTGPYADTSNWTVYHRSLADGQGLYLNTTDAASATNNFASAAAQTSTYFTVTDESRVNRNGNTYVAYIFAHNAGGFGLTGNDNVISCGSYTGNGDLNGPSVTLGFEPQFVIVKATGEPYQNWLIGDTMRGLAVINGTNNAGQYLSANTSDAESAIDRIYPTSTGFKIGTANGAVNTEGGTYIYIAIRRGPMKVPTDGTKVATSAIYSGNNTNRTIPASFVTDLAVVKSRGGGGSPAGAVWADRLRGQPALPSNSTVAEISDPLIFQTNPWDVQGGVKVGTGANYTNNNYLTYVSWMFQRAPGFFDEVCYTGTGATQNITHNLGAVPELMIVKLRVAGSSAAAASWVTYSNFLGNTKYLLLDYNIAAGTASVFWNNTSPTSSVFTVGTGSAVNAGTGEKYVAYLFASCPGVSKVGSYTGTGAAQTINCGFAGGARWVMIKRTDSTGDWYTYDTTRGMVSGTDPYLWMNSDALEVNANYVFTASTGFAIQSGAPAAINASGGTFIYLAIA